MGRLPLRFPSPPPSTTLSLLLLRPLSKSPGTFLPTIGRGIDREPSLSLRPKLSQQRAFFPRLLRSYPCWVPRVVVHGSPHSLFRPPPFMLGRGKEQEGRGMAVGEKCRGPLSFLFHVFPFFCLVVASSSSVGRHAFMHSGCGGTDQARRGNERKNTEPREVPPPPPSRTQKGKRKQKKGYFKLKTSSRF